MVPAPPCPQSDLVVHGRLTDELDATISNTFDDIVEGLEGADFGAIEGMGSEIK